ncbi:MAG: right-handed parallel beta-helix repeat-containing protein, partial [Muribaculaceae bacterium]|nr:right-handed parallel beta-helix repeat-containing protein [Muribaculaceae bacterium]
QMTETRQQLTAMRQKAIDAEATASAASKVASEAKIAVAEKATIADVKKLGFVDEAAVKKSIEDEIEVFSPIGKSQCRVYTNLGSFPPVGRFIGAQLSQITFIDMGDGFYSMGIEGHLNMYNPENPENSHFSGTLGYAYWDHTHEDYEERLDALEKAGGLVDGGKVLAHRFGSDFETSTKAALAYAKANGFSTVDASGFHGEHSCQTRFVLDFPVTLLLGNIKATMADSMFFQIKANNVRIEGCNRQTDRTVSDTNATELVLEGIATGCNDGYHIYSRGNKNCQYRNMVLRGKQTSSGRQCNNSSYPINGTGGIFIEKPNPGTTMAGNTTNATIIENLLIDGTKAHAIYLDTPILSMIRDVRISNAGAHGIFISGGTSTTLESVYVASARYAGFCLQGITYCTVFNSVAENCGCGWWLRSVTNTSLFSPGVETTYNLGLNPWANSQPISKRYGVAEDTLSEDGALVKITDVPDESWQVGPRSIHARSLFCGYAFVVTGGRNVDIYSPYCISIANETDEANPKLNLVKDQLCLMLIMGYSRSVKISNALFQERNTSPIPAAIRHEIEIGSEATGLDLSYNPDTSMMPSWTSITPVTADPSKTAPVLCLSKTSIIHCGNRFYSDMIFLGDVDTSGALKIGGQIMTDTGIITKGPIIDYDAASLNVQYTISTDKTELEYTYNGTEIKIVPKAIFALDNVTDATKFTVYVDGTARATTTGGNEMSFKLSTPGEHSIVVRGEWGEKTADTPARKITVKQPAALAIEFLSTEIVKAEDKTVRLRIKYRGTYIVTEAGIAYSTTNQSPTTSQNSQKLDSLDNIVNDSDGMTHSYEIDLPRSNATTIRYVRGYVRAKENADATTAYATYDTQVYKVDGSSITAI